MNLELIVTKDGSHSLYNPQLDETYHSVGGAIVESQFIYVDKGLKEVALGKNNISILEVGFGTGLNAILTLKESNSSNLSVDYITLEPFPIQEEIICKLNYMELLGDPNIKEDFYNLHTLPWEAEHLIGSSFKFTKIKSRLEAYEAQGKKYDLVYYDAFAPSKQAEIWNIENLKKIFQMLNEEGILITYCANGQFKRDLKESGFLIEKLPGPLGKREITRARKPSA